MDENKEVNSTDPKREKVRVIPLSAIDDAPDHPFGVQDHKLTKSETKANRRWFRISFVFRDLAMIRHYVWHLARSPPIYPFCNTDAEN